MEQKKVVSYFPTTNAYQNYQQIRHFASLNGVRCVSILAVIWHHSGHPDFGLPLLRRGFLGVDMFFVLSGFLIVTLLLRERDRKGQFSLWHFYVRRTLRIFPLYYAIIAILSVYVLIVSKSTIGPEILAALPWLLTYTVNWYAAGVGLLGVAWSLATEEQFYIFWSLIERFLHHIWLWSLLAGVIIVNQLINFGVFDIWLASYGLPREKLEILQITFTPIALGVALAHTLHHPQGFRWLEKLGLMQVWSPAILAVLLLVVISLPVSTLSGWPRFTIHLLMTIWLASLVMQEDHKLRTVMAWKPIDRIGIISYGMYLFHMIALFFATMLLSKLGLLDLQWLRFFLYLGLTIVISELSFRYFESYFLRMKPA